MKTVIEETTTALQAARLELGELKLKNAQEREKLLGEMQQLSTALIQSREQMKEAKETEINLRLLLQNYDEKFNGLQSALKDTNGAYEEFKSEMSRVILIEHFASFSLEVKVFFYSVILFVIILGNQSNQRS